MTDEAPQVNSGKKLALFLVVLVALLVLLAARLYTYDEPFQNDLTFYSLIAHEMLAGKDLYTDVWDHKPPAIFVTYAVAEAIVGFGPQCMFFLSFGASLLCLFGIVYCTKGFFKKRELSVLVIGTGPLLWAILSGDPFLEGNQANTELFQNLCKIWVFGLVLTTNSNKNRWLRFITIGLLCAAASMYKQTSIVFACVLASLYVLYEYRVRRDGRALWQVLLAIGVAISSWLLLMAYYYLDGRFEPFWSSIVTYNMAYSGSNLGLLARLVHTLSFEKILPLRHLVFLILASVIGCWYGLKRDEKSRRGWMLLFAYGLSQLIEVSLPGRFSHHYYFLLCPPIVLGAAFALAEFEKRFSWPFSAKGLAIYLVLTALWLQYPFYSIPSEAWAYIKYPWLEFAKTRAQAFQLKGVLEDDEILYQWGGATGLYYYLNRRPPVSIIYAFHSQYGPVRDVLSARLLRELKESPPDLLAVVQHLSFFSPVANWIMKNYLPLSKIPLKDRVAFFGRRGSRVAAKYGALEMEAIDITKDIKCRSSQPCSKLSKAYICSGRDSGVEVKLSQSRYICALKIEYGIEFEGGGAGASFIEWGNKGERAKDRLMYWLEPGLEPKTYFLWVWKRADYLAIFPHLTPSRFKLKKIELLVADKFDEPTEVIWK